MLAGLNDENVVRLLASDNAYLLETESYSGRPATTTLWSSTDGLTWDESPDAIANQGDQYDRRTAAIAGGFYTWVNGSGFAPPGSVPAFSADGLNWSAVEDAPNGTNLRLADFQRGIVAIDLDRGTLTPRVWNGSFATGRLEWHRLASSDDFFAGGVVTQVVSDGRRAYAFGWDRSTEQPLVWTGNGVQWARTSLPDSFGGYPLTAAAGPHGVVVLGYRHTLRGDNPIVWHRTVVGSWLPERDPMLAAVPNPSADDCPAIPTDYLEFMVVDSAGVVSCYGDAPMTFQAFSVACDDCAGPAEGNPQPAWLLNPNKNQLYLSPQEANGNWWSSVVLGPSLKPDPAWTGSLVELTGHFDDPAASTCRFDLTADSLSYWTGPHTVIDGCRTTFVVTDVKVVSAP